MTVRDQFAIRLLAAALITVTLALGLAAVAEGWRRPSDIAVSSPSGGLLKVCRDGITFQVANVVTSQAEDGSFEPPRPSAAVFSAGFAAYSPPPVDSDGDGFGEGGTVVAEGTYTLQLQATPFEINDAVFWYFGTHTERWAGGQLLEPAPQSLFLDVRGDRLLDSAPYDIEDCFLFRPTTKEQCKKGGYAYYGFRNQGQCVAFVNRGPKR